MDDTKNFDTTYIISCEDGGMFKTDTLTDTIKQQFLDCSIYDLLKIEGNSVQAAVINDSCTDFEFVDIEEYNEEGDTNG